MNSVEEKCEFEGNYKLAHLIHIIKLEELITTYSTKNFLLCKMELLF